MELLGSLWNLLPALPRTLIAFALVLGVLVFVHEMGHYLAARWRGVHGWRKARQRSSSQSSIVSMKSTVQPMSADD